MTPRPRGVFSRAMRLCGTLKEQKLTIGLDLVSDPAHPPVRRRSRPQEALGINARNLYRRHNPQKCRFTSRSEYRCKCPIWVTGTKDGHRIREALKLRDWNRAQDLVRVWDVDGTRPKTKTRATIEEWRDQFLKDAEARNLSAGTLRLYKLLFRQVLEVTIDRGIKFVNELELDALTEFRAGWNIGALSASKKLERLRGIFKFALQRKMVEENYAASLVGPKLKQNPTLPFPKDDVAKILKGSPVG